MDAHLLKPIRQGNLLSVLLKLGGHAKEAPERRRSSPMLAQGVTHPLRILLAEDNVVNQKVALHILLHLGYQADLAATGREAIEAVASKSYDLVLMDVQMPDMDGLEATRRICERWPRTSRPRIVAMTANALAGDRELCLDAGMDDYITKPIRIEDLRPVLMQCSPRRAPTQKTLAPRT